MSEISHVCMYYWLISDLTPPSGMEQNVPIWFCLPNGSHFIDYENYEHDSFKWRL